ncbi:MAG: hypothetical protein EOO43_03075 [Flavobacterium sp.]|nr:MAG: hypothetical protein EOO43_03075 [Flavobacterium sp.]
MQVSEFTLKLILLLIPGAIASIIFEKLTIHKKWSPFQFIANSIMFGGACYLTSQLVLSVAFSTNALSAFWKNLPTKDIPYEVIICGILASPIIGLGFTLLDYYRVINKVGKFLHISNKYGDLNLFTHFLNSPDVTEIYVRDLENNTTYHGKVHSYSETDNIKELLLYDVDIYDNETGALKYSVRSVYLSKPKDCLIIEVPNAIQAVESSEPVETINN